MADADNRSAEAVSAYAYVTESSHEKKCNNFTESIRNIIDMVFVDIMINLVIINHKIIFRCSNKRSFSGRPLRESSSADRFLRGSQLAFHGFLRQRLLRVISGWIVCSSGNNNGMKFLNNCLGGSLMNYVT